MNHGEALGTDLSLWEIGPYHGALPGPMKLRLMLDGEVISSAEVETGFLHRGLEKCLERHSWQSILPYADHLDPEGAIFGELALCLAIEDIGQIEVPPRAKMIRVIVSELLRISCHMAFMVRVAKAVGATTMVHYILRDRERILDLFELLMGARFSHNYLRFGGVKEDVTEGFIERVLETCDLIRVRLKEYNDLFTFNQVFMERSVGVGMIDASTARRLGVTGPNARASGVLFDVRKENPYSGYDMLDFEVPLGTVGSKREPGDSHARFLVRLREISASAEILKQACESLPSGDFMAFRVDKNFVVPRGEAYARIESPRGMLGCYVHSNGGKLPNRIQFCPPSFAHLACLPFKIPGSRLQDLPVLLASLDIGVAEVDR